MPKVRLDEKVAKAATAAGKNQEIYWDTEVSRLGLRVRANGLKVFEYRYRYRGGGERTMKIGKSPEVKVEAARNAARIAAGQLAVGVDPLGERQEARRREKSNVGALVGDGGLYDTDPAGLAKLVNRGTILRALQRHLPASRDVADLTRRELVEIFDRLTPGASQDLRKHTNRLLEFCVNRGLIRHNVLAGMRKAARTGIDKLAANDNPNGHMLSDDEIRRLWTATNTAHPFHRIVRFALLSGVRRKEAAKLTRDMIQADRIVLPAHLTKQRAPHAIPLTPLMREIIDQPSITNLVFESSRDRVAVQAWSQYTKRLSKIAKLDKPLRMHNLRKTCRSLMSKLNVADKVAELAIGHKLSRVQTSATQIIYDLEPLWEPRVKAFEAVDAYVANLVKPQLAAAA